MFMPERWLFDYAYIFYGLAMLLLIAVIVVGKTVYGSKSWLTIGPLTFQPSELGKIATLLAVARSISSRGRDLSSWSDLIIPILLFVFPISLIMILEVLRFMGSQSLASCSGVEPISISLCF
jgi:rod shape determining protein RodA